MARASRRGGSFRRTGVVAAVLLAVLLVGVYAALRMTSLSAVEQVTVIGVEGPRAVETRKALEQAALGQSTLGFDVGALREAVADMPSITGVDASPRFPHGVQVDVHQRVGVGALSVDGRKIAVATDGTLLPEWDAAELPIINGGRATAGQLVTEHRLAARILAAAPDELRERIARIDKTSIVRFADGPALLFHDGQRLAAKWMAATAVLADSSSVGATWIDLRVPERPVAGSGSPPPMPGPSERASDLRADGTVDTTRAASTSAATSADAPASAEAGAPQGTGDVGAVGGEGTPPAAQPQP